MRPFFLESENAWLLLFAVTLDLLWGDPEYLPHMVRYMGGLISKWEPIFRRLHLHTRIQGGLLAVAVVLVSCLAAVVLLLLAEGLYKPLYWIFSTFLLYQALSLRCLAEEVLMVRIALEEQGLKQARAKLSRIVGRDVSSLDEKGVLMASIESCAENLVDGVTSPFFYGALAGPVGAVAFKAISTLDSMIGYKNERYQQFGTVAARLDDLANYIPARLTVFFIAIAAWLLRLNSPVSVLMGVKRDACKHASPNSGLSEAGFAHSLGIRLFGPAQYHGQWVHRPYMNEEGAFPTPRHVNEAVKLLYVTSGLFAGAFFLCAILWG